jgi:hypothetical protein
MDSRPADGSKCVLSAKRWFKARNGTLTVVRIQRTYTGRAAKRWFKSGQTILQVTFCKAPGHARQLSLAKQHLARGIGGGEVQPQSGH